MLSKDDIKLIETSWDYVLMNSREAAIIFYDRLFLLAPELRSLFKGDIHEQTRKLVEMITFIVHKVGSVQTSVEDVHALGIRHKQNLVIADHYQLVGDTLIWTIGQACGERWNNEMMRAWSLAYQELSKMMIAAASVN